MSNKAQRLHAKEVKPAALQMIRDGVMLKDIAELLGVGTTSVCRWKAELIKNEVVKEEKETSDITKDLWEEWDKTRLLILEAFKNEEEETNMLLIKLNYGYFIEIDKLNYTLRQEYESKNGKIAVRTVGHFGSMEDLLYKYLDQCQILCGAAECMEMHEYIKMINEANKNAVSGLYDVLNKFEIK